MRFRVGQYVRLRGLRWRVVDAPHPDLLDLACLEPGQRRRRLRILPSVDRPAPWRPPALPGPGEAPLGDLATWTLLHRAALLLSSSGGTGAPAVPGGVAVPYQTVPLRRLRALPLPRLLVADDTGLGKTVEAGLVLAEELRTGRARRALVVAPAALLEHWQDKLSDHFDLGFEILDRKGLERCARSAPAGCNPWFARDRVILSMDFAKQPGVLVPLARAGWDVLVIDECHHVARRGPAPSLRHRMAQRLCSRCPAVLLLSATPHDGTTHGLSSLLHMLDPLRVPAPDREPPADAADLVVRRTRRQVSGRGGPRFPPRSVRRIPVRLSGPERGVRSSLEDYFRLLEELAPLEPARRALWRRFLKKRWASSPLALGRSLAARRRALEGAEAAPDHLETLRLFPGAAQGLHRRARRASRREGRALADIERSLAAVREGSDAKLGALQRLLGRLWKRHPDEKAVVFTEYRDTLDYLAGSLRSPSPGRIGLSFHGGIGRDGRRRILRRFEQDRDAVLLLATDAAGEGIDLQHACRRLVHYELPWNPNRLEQRNGRIDRFGQARPALVRYFHVPDSPETEVLHRLVRKLGRIRRDIGSTAEVLDALDAGALEEALDAGGGAAKAERIVDGLLADARNGPLRGFRSRNEGAEQDAPVSWRPRAFAEQARALLRREGRRGVPGAGEGDGLRRLCLDLLSWAWSEDRRPLRARARPGGMGRGAMFTFRIVLLDMADRPATERLVAVHVDEAGRTRRMPLEPALALLEPVPEEEDAPLPRPSFFRAMADGAEEELRAWARELRTGEAREREAWVRGRLALLARFRRARLERLRRRGERLRDLHPLFAGDREEARRRRRAALEILERDVLAEADRIESRAGLSEAFEWELLGYCLL